MPTSTNGVAERRLVPVEHRAHAVGVGRVELAVVELVVVVEDRHVPASPASSPPGGSPTSCISGGESGRAARSHRFFQPADLPLEEAVGAAEVGEVDGGRVDGVEVGEGVDDGEADAPTDVGVLRHRRRDGAPDDDAGAVLDHEEVGTDDRVVVAEGEGPWRRRVGAPQARQRAELPLHVVGAGRELPERRPADDEAAIAEAHEVREVGRAVGELQHLHRARRGRRSRPAGSARAPAQSSSSPGRTGASLGPDAVDVAHRVITVQALTPGAPYTWVKRDLRARRAPGGRRPRRAAGGRSRRPGAARTRRSARRWRCSRRRC